MGVLVVSREWGFCVAAAEKESGRKLFGSLSQVSVQVEAFEEAFAHVVRQVGFFVGSLHEVNRPLCGVQNDAAVVASREMPFEFLAKFGTEFAVNVGGERPQQLVAILVDMFVHLLLLMGDALGVISGERFA